MKRKPEFHLYLYSLEGYKEDVINANTMTEIQERIMHHQDVDTYQVMYCMTSLFDHDYRIFVHISPYHTEEITLGTVECFGGRELRMGHDLPRLIVTYLV